MISRRSIRTSLWSMALSACGGSEAPEIPAAPEPLGYRVSVPGELIGRFPPDPFDMDAEILIEGAFGMAIGESGDGVFVLDVTGRRAYHVDRDAKLVAAIGRPGEGPGELQTPVSIRADPRGGVWIADPQLNRLSRFGPDGALLQELRTPHPVINFGVLPGGGPFYPTMRSSSLLSVQPGDEAWELEIEPALVPQEISVSPIDRLARGMVELSVLSPDTLLVFWNKNPTAYQGWTVALGSAGARITDVSPLPLPEWLYPMLEQGTRRPGDSGSGDETAGSEIIPFKSVRVVAGELWLAPAPSGLVIATTIPRGRGDSASVVLPNGPEVDGMLDAAVLGDRLVAMYQTELRVYGLERVDSGRFQRWE